MWIFEEYPPLGGWDMPQTGNLFNAIDFILIGLFMISVGLYLNNRRRRAAKERRQWL
jgi:hypothetical protein